MNAKTFFSPLRVWDFAFAYSSITGGTNSYALPSHARCRSFARRCSPHIEQVSSRERLQFLIGERRLRIQSLPHASNPGLDAFAPCVIGRLLSRMGDTPSRRPCPSMGGKSPCSSIHLRHSPARGREVGQFKLIHGFQRRHGEHKRGHSTLHGGFGRLASHDATHIKSITRWICLPCPEPGQWLQRRLS